MSKKNIILFFPDSFSQNVLTIGKINNVKLKNIEQMIEDGSYFTDCNVQNPVCTPSRCTMFTGRYVHNNGHRSLSNLIQREEKHLLSYLKESGYITNIIGKNDLLSSDIIDDYVIDKDSLNFKPSHFPTPKYDTSDPKYYSFQYSTSDGGVYERDQHFINKAKKFIEEKHDKPYFLFIPINLPHPGYYCSSIYENMYNKDDIKVFKSAVNTGKPMYHDLIRKSRKLDLLDDSEFRDIKATYYKMCMQVDEYLGQIMESVNEDDTTVIFTSDHGDYQGNYNLVEKWPSSTEEEIVNVPLIIKGPSIPKGVKFSNQVELIDVMETILDLAGSKSTEVNFSKSLLPLINGETTMHKEYVFCEGGYDPHEPHNFEGFHGIVDRKSMYFPKAYLQQVSPSSVCRFVMIKSARYKLVKRTRDICELYDLDKDPDEVKNEYYNSDYSEIVAKLEGEILNWYITTTGVAPTKIDKRGF